MQTIEEHGVRFLDQAIVFRQRLVRMRIDAGSHQRRHLEVLSDRIHETLHRHLVSRQAIERKRRHQQLKLVETLHGTVASVKHEINNPLAIISGNAQLLLELSRMMDLDEDLVKPIRDIEEASLRIIHSLNKLNSIKDLVAREHINGEENHNGISYR